MHEPSITVVVPVYNVVMVLHHCVKSLLLQEFDGYEVLLVDDGSTDGSAEICDGFSRECEFVRVLHQKNAGLSAARNAGVRLARGEWISFVDADDFVFPSFLEELYNAAVVSEANVVCCELRKVSTYDMPEKALKKTSLCVMPADKALEQILYQRRSDVSACNKLFRKQDIEKCPFPEGRAFEDILPVTQIFLRAEKVCFLTEALYCYYQRANSIMHSMSLKACIDEADMTDSMLEIVKRECPEVFPAAQCKAFSNYCQIRMSIGEPTPQFEQLSLRVDTTLQQFAGAVFRNKYARKKNRMAAALFKMAPKLLLLQKKNSCCI